MKKILPLIILFVFSFSAIHAETGWKLENGTLTISGTGNMTDYKTSNTSDIPWFPQRKEIKKVVIEDGVTSIGSFAFDGCDVLTSVKIPNSVTSIGDNAFWNCEALTSVEIPNSVTTIGNVAFQSCTSLTSVTIPNSVTNIGVAAFAGCI